MEKEDKKRQIPFNKAVNVGNFKLWRARFNDVEVVNASSLDGAWMVRIPSTIEMYGWLCMSYSDYMSDDVDAKAQGEAVLTTVLSNILYASSIGNGYYQRALELCATVYAHPSLVDRKSKEHKGFMKDVKAIVDMFLEWRKDYDERVKTLEPTEKDMHQDEIADEALEILNESE